MISKTRCLSLLGFLVANLLSTFAQPLPVSFTVDPGRDTARISPFIYGSNGQSSDWQANITARRLGGNRLTGYNWENNASNMGIDYNGSSANDNYLTWVAGIPSSKENVPGIVLTNFHDTSIAMNCYSVLTLPAAGFVSRDKNGPVGQAEQAPSPRWRQVRFAKGSSFSLAPDTSDAWVSVDEEVNFLVARYGGAGTPNGVRAYEVDNEPALWSSSHPRLHPAQPTIAEIIAKNVAMSRAVKAVDPAAEMFGAVTYGFSEMYNFQDAPDWSTYQSFGRYVNAFLSMTHDSSVAAGRRLIDVIDIHWYPDLNIPIALNDNVDSASAAARVYAPRSLWDSTYVENGWIGQWFSPIALLPSMQTSIRRYYPGTKLAITEFNYGAPGHVSGGLAVADVLGLFGRYGVYLAAQWGAIEGYAQSAYELYRNYDGRRSAFGDVGVYARTSDKANSSVYAAVESSNPSVLHIVVLNKNFSRTLDASIILSGPQQFQHADIYGFDLASATVRTFAPVTSIAANTIGYSIPPQSAYHFVVSSVPASVTDNPDIPGSFGLQQNFPNPFNPGTTIRYTIAHGTQVVLEVYDVLGRRVEELVRAFQSPGSHEVTWNASRYATGVYVCRLRAEGRVTSMRMTLIK